MRRCFFQSARSRKKNERSDVDEQFNNAGLYTEEVGSRK